MLRILTPTDYIVTPWKNRLGTTIEIARDPPASAGGFDFDWRVSIADVVADGPFSAFPGLDRTIIALSGAGLLLTVGGGAPHRLLPLEPYRFDGGAPASGRLIDGPVRDFNVMVRRGWRRSRTEVVRAGEVDLAPDNREVVLAHVVHGAWLVMANGRDQALAPGGTLRAEAPAAGVLKSLGTADVALLVTLTALKPALKSK